VSHSSYQKVRRLASIGAAWLRLHSLQAREHRRFGRDTTGPNRHLRLLSWNGYDSAECRSPQRRGWGDPAAGLGRL